jgi:8-oxo-dGTP pyrophosphatase MutT (NUDIX family)
MVRPDDCPGWLAVLILIGGVGPDEATVVLTERAVGLRDHPGEVSFPGGSWEHGDASPVATALREAAEETGVDPADVTPLALLPRLFIRASGFDVTAVVGYWHRPGPLATTDPAETLRVLCIPLRRLAEPARWRDYVTAGWHGPSTRLDDDALVWGYTAEVSLSPAATSDASSTVQTACAQFPDECLRVGRDAAGHPLYPPRARGLRASRQHARPGRGLRWQTSVFRPRKQLQSGRPHRYHSRRRPSGAVRDDQHLHDRDDVENRRRRTAHLAACGRKRHWPRWYR